MDLGIKGKKVLVTGASQGIGKEIALSFAREGCKVSIIARREDKLKEVLQEMGGEEQGHAYRAIDLMPEENPPKALKDLLGKNGNYDIVIHNIGGSLEIRDPAAPFEDWYKVWRFNAGIAIQMNHFLIPPMQRQGWGRIIHISSQAAEGLRGCPAYGVSKAYLNAYTKALGKRIAQDSIVVSAIAPGAIDAPGGHWNENSPENINEKQAFLAKKSDFLKHHQAIGRLGKADEISSFALFMASKYVTFANGSVIFVDGGTE